jgi:hypothetical protein
MALTLSLVSGCSNLQTTHYGFEPLAPSQTSTSPTVYWQLADNALSDEDKLYLENVVSSALLPIMTAKPNIYMRAKITQVDTVSPLLNGISSLLLILPLDRGGASVEIQALDSSTGVEMLRESYTHQVPFSEYKAHFSRLEPAKIALSNAIQQFTARMKLADEDLYTAK